MTLSLQLAGCWAGFLGLWLLFTHQVTKTELLAGAIAGAFTVISGFVVFRIVPACFKPQLRWIVQIYRLPWMIAEDLWRLFKCLLGEISKHPLRSTFATTPFSTVPNSCEAAAQRALVVLLLSTTPNSIVVDVDGERNRLFYHQVEPAAVPKLVRRLEL